MTSDDQSRPVPSATNDNTDPASGLPVDIDPRAVDLGDDAVRDATNHGSSMADGAQLPDSDPASGLPIPIDPGTTDLGDDAHRPASQG